MVYITSSSIKNDDIGDSLQSLIGVGITNIELSGGTKYRSGVEDLLVRYKQKFNLNLLVHNYFPPPEEDFILNIASYEKEQRNRSIELVKRSIHLSASLGQDRYTVHAGYSRFLLPPVEDDMFIPRDGKIVDVNEAMKYLYSSLDELESVADETGVRIGIENLFPINSQQNSSLLCTPDEIFSFIDKTEEKAHIGILLDMGHLAISSNHFNFKKDIFLQHLVDNYHNRIFEVHLSGNDGVDDSHMMLDADDWQLDVAIKIATAVTDIPISIECRGVTPQEAAQQYEMVNEKLIEAEIC